MNLQLPADIDTTLKSFLAGGRYENEVEVLREALATLKHRDVDIAAIQKGIDDEEAGRIRPFEEIDAELRAKHGFLGE
ncbi:MAG: hypothetical protein GXP26_09975 [Planctomycetes bacterium]|nr:hypothetical protein [Planctomycetota bacterium]